MRLFNPFNSLSSLSAKTVAAPKRTGLIGHWKTSEDRDNANLMELIGLLQNGDEVTLVFGSKHARGSAVTMLHLRRILRLAQKSLRVFAIGLLRQELADAALAKQQTTYEATVVGLNGTAQQRKKTEQYLYHELHEHVIEFRVFRKEEDLI